MTCEGILKLDQLVRIKDPQVRLLAYENWKAAWTAEAWIDAFTDPEVLAAMNEEQRREYEIEDTRAALEALGNAITGNALTLNAEERRPGEPIAGVLDPEGKSASWPRTRYSVFVIQAHPTRVVGRIILPTDLS